MTNYQHEISRLVAARMRRASPSRVIEELCRIGVVDPTLCKVLAVRIFVDEKVARGHLKMDAFHMAAERFSVSLSYVKKCLYYYRDVNLS